MSRRIQLLWRNKIQFVLLFRKSHPKLFAAESDISSRYRAKLIEQLKKSPNNELKRALENLAATWNPLLEEAKMKKASSERACDLVEQLEDSLKKFTSQIDEHRSLLNEKSKTKVCSFMRQSICVIFVRPLLTWLRTVGRKPSYFVCAVISAIVWLQLANGIDETKYSAVWGYFPYSFYLYLCVSLCFNTKLQPSFYWENFLVGEGNICLRMGLYMSYSSDSEFTAASSTFTEA